MTAGSGSLEHQWTSWAAKNAVFEFLEKSYFDYIEKKANRIIALRRAKAASALKLLEQNNKIATELSNKVNAVTEKEVDSASLTLNQAKNSTAELLIQEKSTAVLLN